MKLKKRTIIIIVAVVVLAVGIGIFLGTRNKGTEKGPQERITTVLVRKAEKSTLKRFLDLYAEFKAENEVELKSPVTGKVMSFSRLEGQKVARGQGVVTIDRFEVGARYAPATVQSPVSGVVTRILVSKGEDVNVGTSVAVVGNTDNLEARIQVPEVFASEVKIGQEVLFKTQAVPGRIFTGKITRKDLSLDPTTRSLTMRVMVPNPDHTLFSGIYAESFIFIEEARDVYVVPDTALSTTKEGQPAIFVNNNGIAVLRPVKIALRYRDQAAISEGIQDGDEMIVFGREYLSEGAPIRALFENTEQKPAQTASETAPSETAETLQ